MSIITTDKTSFHGITPEAVQSGVKATFVLFASGLLVFFPSDVSPYTAGKQHNEFHSSVLIEVFSGYVKGGDVSITFGQDVTMATLVSAFRVWLESFYKPALVYH